MMREEGNCPKKELMQGTVPGARKQERPRMQWNGNMGKWAVMSFEKLLRETRDIGRWSRLVHDANNPRSEDG